MLQKKFDGALDGMCKELALVLKLTRRNGIQRGLGILGASLALGVAAQPSSPTPPTSHLARIQAQKTVRVCIWPDYYSISYRNPKTLQLSGIDVEMAQALAHDLGVAVQFVDSSFAKLVADLTQDRCDVAMFAVGVTPERQAVLSFTQPHLASDIYAVGSQTNRRVRSWADIDQPGTVVAVAKGTLHEPVMRRKLTRAKLLVLDTPFAREQEVQAGRADVFMTDYPYSQRFLAQAAWAQLIKPETTYHLTPYAYAVAPHDPAWLDRLNGFVAAIKADGRLRAAAQRHGLVPILAP